nr:hypothetical protein [Candidatus Chloroploca sp. Khr17]
MLVRKAPPSLASLGISRGVALLGVTERRRDVLVAQARADGVQAHPVLDKGWCVTVAKLVQGTMNASLRAGGRPTRLDGLVA